MLVSSANIVGLDISFTRRVRQVKIHHMQVDREIFCAYYGNTAVDLDPLPVNHVRLTVVKPALLKLEVFEMAAPIQSSAKCEVCSFIRLLNAKGERPAEIYKRIIIVQGNVINFNLFLHLKKHLAGKKFDYDDDEVQEEVVTWFKGQAAHFYDSGIQKMVPKLNKYLDNAGDCVEK